MLLEQLDGRAPALAKSALVDVDTFAGPAPAIASFDFGVMPTACGQAVAVSREPPVLPGRARWLSNATASRDHITVELLDWDCGTHDSAIERTPIPSSYVAGSQQTVNPEYTALQVQLQAAQAELNRIVLQKAVNPPANAWAGAAVGIQEGAARARVTGLLNKLQQTAPYLSHSVLAPYTAYRLNASRTAFIRARLVVTDKLTGLSSSSAVGVDLKSSANAVEGVLNGDQSGLRNTPIEFAAAHDLFRTLSPGLTEDLKSAIKQGLGHMLLQRAGRMMSQKESAIRVVAQILLARDAGATSESLAPFDNVLSLARSETPSSGALEGLVASRFGLPSPSSKTDEVGRRDGGPLRAVLAAVVTIEAESSSGSGFFVQNGRYALTNAHVVGGSVKVKLRTANKSSLLGTVIKTSDEHDLALIEVSGGFPASLVLGDSDALEVGTDILAVGSPLGLSGSVTKGIVSAVRRFDSGSTWLQIDASLNRGNSGGPLILPDGRVVGINSWKLRGEAIEGLAFAVSVNDAKRVFNHFLK